MKNAYKLLLAACSTMFLCSAAQAQTKTLPTKQDVYIANTTAGMTTAYGTTDPQKMITRFNNFNFKRKSYIQFDLTGLQEADFNNVTLRLYGGMNSMDEDVKVYIHPLPNDTWDEATVTWKTRPEEQMAQNTAIDSVTLLPAEFKYYEWKQMGPYLKSQFQAGKTQVSFRLESGNSFSIPEVHWNTKEAPDNRPQLVLNSTITGFAKDKAETELTFYPNPAAGQLTLQLHHKHKGAGIEVYNMQGQKTLSVLPDELAGPYQLDISNLRPGTYILRLSGNHQVATKKFVKL